MATLVWASQPETRLRCPRVAYSLRLSVPSSICVYMYYLRSHFIGSRRSMQPPPATVGFRGQRHPKLPMRTMNGKSGNCSSLSHSDSPKIWYNINICFHRTAVVIHQTQLCNPSTSLAYFVLCAESAGGCRTVTTE